MYEALFFNVTDRLDARDWITLQAVRWWEFNPAAGRDPATVLRAYAYHGGPLLLDAALPYLLGDRMDVPPGLDPTSPEGRLDRSLRLAVLLGTAPWGAKPDAKLLKLHAELLVDCKKASSARPTESVVARNALEVLDNLGADALQRGGEQGRAVGDEAHQPESRATAEVG
jgi:hypothetical protein